MRLTGFVLALLFAPAAAGAVPGDLDQSYGSGGVATIVTGLGMRSSPVIGIDLGAANLVTVRVVPEGGRYVARLERLLLNGQPDPAFVPANLFAGDGDLIPTGLDRDSLGRIYIAGFARVGRASAFAVVRTDAAGVLDPAFGAGGRVLVPYPALAPDLDQTLRAANPPGSPPVLLADGGVAVALRARGAGGSVASVVLQVDGAGAPVVAFGGDGIADPTPATTGVMPDAIVQDGAGRILLTGDPVGVPARPLMVVALTPAGVPDPAYGGGDGVATTALGGTIGDAALVRFGAVVFAAGVNQNRAFVLARFAADGQLDPALDGDGVAISADTNVATLAGAVLGSAGGFNFRIDVAGASLAGIVFRRAHPATGFEAAGGTVAIPPGGFVSARALVLGTGGPYAAGLLREDPLRRPYLASWDFVADAPRAAFGTGGQVIGDVPAPGREVFNATSGLLAASGGVRIAGVGDTDGVLGARVVGFTPAGAPDAGFGVGGVATTGLGGTLDIWGDVALLAGGRIALAGSSRVAAEVRPAGLVLGPAGVVDPVFTPFRLPGAAPFASGSAVVGDSGGVVYGITEFAVGATASLVRFRADGARDLGFGGGDGHVDVAPGAGGSVTDLLRQPSGRLVVAVAAVAVGAPSFLRAYTSVGAPDPAFGAGGTVALPPGVYPVRLGSFPDGDIVVGGAIAGVVPPGSAVLRYSRNGAPRPTYAGDGRAEVGHPTDGARLTGLAPLPDGRLYVALALTASSFVDGSGFLPSGSRIVRLRGDGSADSAFGGDGVVDPPLGPEANAAGVAIEPGGRALLFGSDEGVGFVARLLGDPPSASTRRADRLGRTSARVSGRLTPRGGRTTWWIEYGRTKTYGKRTKKLVIGPATARTVRAILRGLRPGTVYHYRLVAQNGSGITRGRDRTVRTRR